MLGLVTKAGLSILATLLALLIADRAVIGVSSGSASSRFDDTRGYQIFTSRCEVCHAKEAGDLSKLGPNLSNVGAVAATRRAGLNAPEYILESIMQPGAFTAPGATGVVTMPEKLVADLPDDDIRHLVAHVARLGARPDDGEIAALDIGRRSEAGGTKLEVRRDQMEYGERVFREKCQDCHSLHSGAEYIVLAPAVFGVGFRDEEKLRASITHHNIPVSETLTPEDVEALIALITTLN
jgi:cytochrome c2